MYSVLCFRAKNWYCSTVSNLERVFLLQTNNDSIKLKEREHTIIINIKEIPSLQIEILFTVRKCIIESLCKGVVHFSVESINFQ